MNTLTLAENSWRQFWLGRSLGASPEAAHTENLYMYILWVNIISFVVLMAIMGYYMLKYRRSNQAKNYQTSASHNTPLELAWSIIPLLVMVPIFWFGFTGYVGKLAAPTDAEEISIVGKRWNWDFVYRTGATPQATEGWEAKPLNESGLTVPVFAVPQGRPVKLVMNSLDVIHAFYIPDFRLKMDVQPNRQTSMWFVAPELGEHKVFCAEYCGQDHSEMGAIMRVVPIAEYEQLLKTWTAPPGNINWIKIGEILANKKGCFSCHTIDGKNSTGPTWKDLYRHPVEFTDGSSLNAEQADANYIRESILVPGAKVVKGFANQMPSFQGQLKPDELFALIMYIKSLSPEKFTPEEKARGERTPNQDKQENVPQDLNNMSVAPQKAAG
jgi:cytochrome c oxidase subunit 2